MKTEEQQAIRESISRDARRLLLPFLKRAEKQQAGVDALLEEQADGD